MVEMLFAALPDSPSFTEKRIWQDGDSILCPDRETANRFADLLKEMTQGQAEVTTGYYDPEEDLRYGNEDRYTGYWYIDITM